MNIPALRRDALRADTNSTAGDCPHGPGRIGLRGRLTRSLHASLAWIENHRLFRPWRHHFGRRALWSFDRRAVARAVAIGFFFGVLTPVAQIVFATIASIVLRANLLVAAGSTLITNPFTTPFILYGAFRVGVLLTGSSHREVVDDVIASEQAASRALEVSSWFTTLTDWVSSVGFPLVVGLLTIAIVLSVIGYLLAYVSWGMFPLRKKARRS